MQYKLTFCVRVHIFTEKRRYFSPERAKPAESTGIQVSCQHPLPLSTKTSKSEGTLLKSHQ